MSNKNNNTMRLVLHEQLFEVDKICKKESEGLRAAHYRDIVLDAESFGIKKERILETALDYCVKRAEIKINYKHDKKIRKSKLKDFDSDFLKHLDDDDIPDLIDAAGKLEIYSLYVLLFEDAERVISQMTTTDIEVFFDVRYNGDDRLFRQMNYVLDATNFPFREIYDNFS